MALKRSQISVGAPTPYLQIWISADVRISQKSASLGPGSRSCSASICQHFSNLCRVSPTNSNKLTYVISDSSSLIFTWYEVPLFLVQTLIQKPYTQWYEKAYPSSQTNKKEGLRPISSGTRWKTYKEWHSWYDGEALPFLYWSDTNWVLDVQAPTLCRNHCRLCQYNVRHRPSAHEAFW